MKQIEETFKRKMKYWRVGYQQASGRDRLVLGFYAFFVLLYAWWYTLLP